MPKNFYIYARKNFKKFCPNLPIMDSVTLALNFFKNMILNFCLNFIDKKLRRDLNIISSTFRPKSWGLTFLQHFVSKSWGSTSTSTFYTPASTFYTKKLRFNLNLNVLYLNLNVLYQSWGSTSTFSFSLNVLYLASTSTSTF